MNKTKSDNTLTNETFLRNGVKTQNQISKNSFVTTIEKPGINESGIEAKKKGF